MMAAGGGGQYAVAGQFRPPEWTQPAWESMTRTVEVRDERKRCEYCNRPHSRFQNRENCDGCGAPR